MYRLQWEHVVIGYVRLIKKLAIYKNVFNKKVVVGP